MNLQTYIENLQKLLDENPDLATAEVWSASDDEGNSYQVVGCLPSLRLVEHTETYSTESARDLNDEFDDLAGEVGVYLEDFANKEEYLAEATSEIEKTFKTVVLIN